MLLPFVLCASLSWAPELLAPIDQAIAPQEQVCGIKDESEADVKREVADIIYSAFHVNWRKAWVIADAAYNSSKRYGVPFGLVLSVITAESAFNNNAVSSTGAIGLMQLMPSTAEFIDKKLSAGKYDIHDVRTNIRFGTWYLGHLARKYHSYDLAVHAYNCGPSWTDVVLTGQQSYPTETIEYHFRIWKTISVFQSEVPALVAQL